MCELTEGKETICDSAGGSKVAYLYSLKDSLGISIYAAPPTITAGEITAMAFKTGKQAYAFNVETETLDGNTNSIGEKANSATAYEHTTVIKLAGNSAADIALAQQLCKGRVGVILQLNDGTLEAYHFEEGIGGKVQRSRTVGVALEDFNGSTLTITSKQTLPEMKIDSTIVDSLLIPAT